MEVDYNLKTSGERFQILCLYLTKIIENLLWFALLAKIHLISPSWCPGAFCVRVKAFNLNFSEVLTKREENHRDTAPLIKLITTSTAITCFRELSRKGLIQLTAEVHITKPRNNLHRALKLLCCQRVRSLTASSL